MSEGGTEESDLEKILSKLTTTEKVVQGLLSLQNGSPPGQVLAVVEKKLEHFEELISHIPSPQKALRNTWDEKVVDLWIRFAGVGCDDAVQPVISSSNTAATTTQPAGSMANENVTSSITNQQAQDNPKDKVLQQPSVFRYASPARRRTNTRPPFSNQYRSRNLPPRLKRVYEQDNNNFNDSYVDSSYSFTPNWQNDDLSHLPSQQQKQPFYTDNSLQITDAGIDWGAGAESADSNKKPIKPLTLGSNGDINEKLQEKPENVYPVATSPTLSEPARFENNLLEPLKFYSCVEPLTTDKYESAPQPATQRTYLKNSPPNRWNNSTFNLASSPVSESSNFANTKAEIDWAAKTSTNPNNADLKSPAVAASTNNKIFEIESDFDWSSAPKSIPLKASTNNSTGIASYRPKPVVSSSLNNTDLNNFDWSSTPQDLLQVSSNTNKSNASPVGTFKSTELFEPSCSLNPSNHVSTYVPSSSYRPKPVFENVSSNTNIIDFDWASAPQVSSNAIDKPDVLPIGLTKSIELPKISFAEISPKSSSLKSLNDGSIHVPSSSYRPKPCFSNVSSNTNIIDFDWASAPQVSSNATDKPDALPIGITKSIELPETSFVEISPKSNPLKSLNDQSIHVPSSSYRPKPVFSNVPSNTNIDDFDWASAPQVSSNAIDKPDALPIGLTKSIELPEASAAKSPKSSSLNPSNHVSTDVPSSSYRPRPVFKNVPSNTNINDFDWASAPASEMDSKTEMATKKTVSESSHHQTSSESEPKYGRLDWSYDSPSKIIQQRLTETYKMALHPQNTNKILVSDLDVDWSANLSDVSVQSVKASEANEQKSSSMVQPSTSRDIQKTSCRSSSLPSITTVDVIEDFNWSSSPIEQRNHQPQPSLVCSSSPADGINLVETNKLSPRLQASNGSSFSEVLFQDLERIETEIIDLLESNPGVDTLDSKLSEMSQLVNMIPLGQVDSTKWKTKLSLFQNKTQIIISSHASFSNQITVSDRGSNSLPVNQAKSEANLAQHLHYLNNLELNIRNMFSGPLPLPKKELEHNLSLLAESVVRLPSERVDLINYWASTVAELMEKFNHEFENPRSRSASTDQARLGSPSTATNFDRRSPSAATSHRSSFASDVEYTKSQLLIKIDNIFARMEPIRDETDLMALRNLVVVLAKTRKLSQPFSPAFDCHISVIRYALDRLPQQICQEYEAECQAHGSKKTLSSLIFFILNHLKKTDDQHPPYSDGFCVFCKTVGHVVFDCVELKNHLCYNCYKFGHSDKHCNDKSITNSKDFFILYNSL